VNNWPAGSHATCDREGGSERLDRQASTCGVFASFSFPTSVMELLWLQFGTTQ